MIVVGRMSKSNREAVTRLRNQLVHLDAPVLGIVANELKGNADGYGYGYAYAYAADGEADKPSRRGAGRAG